MKQLMNLHHTSTDRQFPRFLLQHQIDLVGYVCFTWGVLSDQLVRRYQGFHNMIGKLKIKIIALTFHMDFFLLFYLVTINNLVYACNLLVSLALFISFIKKNQHNKLVCVFLYANDLHYLIGEITDIKEVVLKIGKSIPQTVDLETQTLVPEVIVILYFEMLRTFYKPMSLINNESGGYAFL